MLDISRDPIIRKAYELCLMIEEFPASKEQTNLTIKASELLASISEFVKKNNKIQVFQCTKKDMFPYII